MEVYSLRELNSQVALKAPLVSPAITGTPTINGANISAYGSNFIINGGFDRWDYATSQTSNGYGSDNRWTNMNTGSTKTHSQVVSGDTERALFSSPYYSRTVVSSVVGVGNYVDKVQFIENVTKLARKTITVSFWARADSTKNIAIDLLQLFGTGGSPSTSLDSIGTQLIPLTTSWQKKSVTITMPSIAGKTIGTDGIHTTKSALRFWFDAGTTYAQQSSNLGQQSGTFDIAEVQLEEGSVATPWTPYNGEFGGEIQACARYYQELSSYRVQIASSVLEYTELFPVQMRTTPIATTIYNGGGATISYSGTLKTRAVIRVSGLTATVDNKAVDIVATYSAEL